MDNADRRNIHALAACCEAGMDWQVPPPDKDDGTGMSRIVRRSRCETLRLIPPRLSRIGMQRPDLPHDHPRSIPAAPTRDRTVRRCCGLRVPNLGEKREEFCAVLRRHTRRRMRSTPPRNRRCLQHPDPGGTAKIRTGRTRPTRAAAWGVTATGGRRPPHRRRGPNTPATASAHIVSAGPIGVVRQTL